MANKVQNPETDLMVETKGKLEIFFDNYGNKLLWGLVGITVIAVAIFLVVSIMNGSSEKRENTAQAALTVALTTEAGVEEYVAIVDEYEGTKAANTAVYMAAGVEELLAERKKIGYMEEGDVAITPGFKLPAKFVIHTPEPVWHGGNHNEAELLKNCYLNSLALAKENNCKTVAFPCISTGVYHFPKEQAALIALETVLSNITAPIEKVIFCCFSDSDAEIYRKIAAKN